MPKPRQLRDDEVVYIAIRNPNLMNAETGKIKRNAFFLRLVDMEGEPNGLSVTVLNHCPTIEEIKDITGLKSKVCGVDILSVGEIRQMGLDVNRVAETKAFITGLPYVDPESIDYAAAQQRDILADGLVQISQTGNR